MPWNWQVDGDRLYLWSESEDPAADPPLRTIVWSEYVSGLSEAQALDLSINTENPGNGWIWHGEFPRNVILDAMYEEATGAAGKHLHKEKDKEKDKEKAKTTEQQIRIIAAMAGEQIERYDGEVATK